MCVMCDEMAIRKHVEWDDNKKEFSGYVNCGPKNDSDNLPIAKEALIYMVSGVNHKFKLPVAYFFINGLTAEEKASISKEIFEFLKECGVKIIGFTFDGLPANISMCNKMGADFKNNKTYIDIPESGGKVYPFLDACHMHKLTRNCLASKKTIYDKDNNEIKWEYFERLEKLQNEAGFRLNNKFGKKHIGWKKRKMSVRIAVETLSNSVADTMEFLKNENNADFIGCEATVKFIRYMNNIFDCLNSKNPTGKGYKAPISATTAPQIFAFFNEAIDYIQHIKLNRNGPSILTTKSSTPFFGYILDMQNLMLLYDEYVANTSTFPLHTFRFSQDHLETFFGCIRSMNGCNDNPTTLQFTAAYKKLLIHNEISPSMDGNCEQSDVNVLSTSSRKKKIDEPVNRVIERENSLDYEEAVYRNIEYQLQTIEQHALHYDASCVEQQTLKKFKCTECKKELEEDEKILDSFIEFKSNVEQPCVGTVIICETCEGVMRNYEDITKIPFNELSKVIFDELSFEYVYEGVVFHNVAHKKELIDFVISLYVKKRMDFFAKQKALECQENYLRPHLSKLIHFLGQ